MMKYDRQLRTLALHPDVSFLSMTLKYISRICSSYGPQNQPSMPSDLFSYAQSLSWHSKSLDPTGLILMGKRYYDPKAGRFISPDPVGHPICMDLYAYASGDPVNYFDPDGRFASNVYQTSKPTVIAGLDHITGYSQTVGALNRLSDYCYDHNLTQSESFQVGSFDLPNGAISFVNGIANTKEESMAKAQYLSGYAGGAKVYGVYNASNSMIGDLIDSVNYMSRCDFVTHFDIVGKMRHRDELTILDPHPDASFFDHDFLSPTFAPVIQYHINKYFENYGV
ncbi:MAG: RHS repeat-associated core domain-containing protein [Simkaniaceae bacterium]